MMAQPSILEALKTANLDDMRRELQELEGKLELATQQYRKDIDALKLVIKLVDTAQNGKQVTTRKPRQPKEAKSTPSRESGISGRLANGPTIGDRAVTYLEVAGTDTPTAIASGIKLENPASIYAILSGDRRFEKTASGAYRLSGK